MHDRPARAVEDYTGTCLVLFLLNLFWMLVALKVVFGWPAALLAAGALHLAINRLGERRAAREAAFRD